MKERPLAQLLGPWGVRADVLDWLHPVHTARGELSGG